MKSSQVLKPKNRNIKKKKKNKKKEENKPPIHLLKTSFSLKRGEFVLCSLI